ncbi:pantetheine-phosphate adenylyltransferase [Nocardioides sp. B-3]|uniref:pantetheine-phosphate adenylyltransferase n=1 Tax=Nocardioides sp. B-3 TaxID=2895565 RepID=UPI00300DC939
MPERTPGRLHRAVCPGSFDPVTNGHLDIIGRSAKLFDEVVVAVGVNKSKNRLFSAEERIEMLGEACAGWDNVRVDGFTGLLTDFCLQNEIDAIVKGLRAVTDFDYELQMAQMNSSPGPGRRDGLRADEPRVVVPGQQPGQGSGHLRWRRDRPGARVRARAAAQAAGRARERHRLTSVLPVHPPDGYDSVVLFSVRFGVK